ncbi:hypothetical protein CGH21_25250 [Vibrio parahaemolyticus]|nr:hypothetical protein CGH64_25010 [Vibrio parahaemolyticus]TON27898.1 hypothetical protein CGH59_25280 [Vibrio parahaemolyticus]TON45649.1 hypothetical protein CGH55_25075 [Vibrio parahaemolyticus]TON63985.1 hypothetical protein CGH52_25115 [Vibrio parahaemolyticus]TON99139.1 hypothetical protein CGH46_24480 [Vibrio parahaemolyticus]
MLVIKVACGDVGVALLTP